MGEFCIIFHLNRAEARVEGQLPEGQESFEQPPSWEAVKGIDTPLPLFFSSLQYVLSYITNFSSDMFQELLKHLLQCANDARHMIRHDFWRQMFFRLFLDCDHGKVTHTLTCSLGKLCTGSVAVSFSFLQPKLWENTHTHHTPQQQQSHSILKIQRPVRNQRGQVNSPAMHRPDSWASLHGPEKPEGSRC